MCSRPFETRSRHRFLAATLATLPSMSLFPKAPFDLSVCPSMSLASRRLHLLVATFATSWRVIEGFSVGLVIPDLWQQEAVRALQQGKDVVVQAPTGSGKTYIFELLYPN